MKGPLAPLLLALAAAPLAAAAVQVVAYDSQADVKVIFVAYESQADLRVHFVRYDSQAGWRREHPWQGRLAARSS